jgi:hypothetical protein
VVVPFVKDPLGKKYLDQVNFQILQRALVHCLQYLGYRVQFGQSKTKEAGEILPESFFLHQIIHSITRAAFKKEHTDTCEYDFINTVLAVMPGIYHLAEPLIEIRKVMADHFGHLIGHLPGGANLSLIVCAPFLLFEKVLGAVFFLFSPTPVKAISTTIQCRGQKYKRLPGKLS